MAKYAMLAMTDEEAPHDDGKGEGSKKRGKRVERGKNEKGVHKGKNVSPYTEEVSLPRWFFFFAFIFMFSVLCFCLSGGHRGISFPL